MAWFVDDYRMNRAYDLYNIQGLITYIRLQRISRLRKRKRKHEMI